MATPNNRQPEISTEHTFEVPVWLRLRRERDYDVDTFQDAHFVSELFTLVPELAPDAPHGLNLRMEGSAEILSTEEEVAEWLAGSDGESPQEAIADVFSLLDFSGATMQAGNRLDDAVRRRTLRAFLAGTAGGLLAGGGLMAGIYGTVENQAEVRLGGVVAGVLGAVVLVVAGISAQGNIDEALGDAQLELMDAAATEAVFDVIQTNVYRQLDAEAAEAEQATTEE